MTHLASVPIARSGIDDESRLCGGRRQRRAIVVCDQWLGSNGYAGMKALRRAGWSVLVVPEWESVPVRWTSPLMRVIGRAIRPLAVREFNRLLITQAIRTTPDLLLVFKGMFIQAAALKRLRMLGTRLLCFYPDVSFRTHGPYLPAALPEYDWIFTTKSFGVKDLQDQLGVNRASVVRHAFDPDLHRPTAPSTDDLKRYGCDVSFIGTWSPKKERILQELRARLPSLQMRIWGEQWATRARSTQLDEVIQRRGVEGEEYVRAIASSKINLAILSERRLGASSGDLLTSRTFHIPACGGFMLHERTAELLDVLHEPSEVACFDNVDEMVAKIEYFLGEDAARRGIAVRGRERIRAAHSWDQRVREILDAVERLP